MTVVKALNSRNKFAGLSTDTKPTGVPATSTFLEDTGNLYFTYDGTNWKITRVVGHYIIEQVLHPWGKGLLTAGGAQYDTNVTGIGQTYTTLGTKTIVIPAGYTLDELEFSVMGRTISSGAVDSILYKVQCSDAGTTWDDISAEITRAASCAAAADFADALSGRVLPSTNSLLTGASFQLRVVAKSGGATNTAGGALKNTTYVILRLHRT